MSFKTFRTYIDALHFLNDPSVDRKANITVLLLPGDPNARADGTVRILVSSTGTALMTDGSWKEI